MVYLSPALARFRRLRAAVNVVDEAIDTPYADFDVPSEMPAGEGLSGQTGLHQNEINRTIEGAPLTEPQMQSLSNDGENTMEDPDLKLGNVEAPYSSGDGPMGTMFDDDHRHDITKGASFKMGQLTRLAAKPPPQLLSVFWQMGLQVDDYETYDPTNLSATKPSHYFVLSHPQGNGQIVVKSTTDNRGTLWYVEVRQRGSQRMPNGKFGKTPTEMLSAVQSFIKFIAPKAQSSMPTVDDADQSWQPPTKFEDEELMAKPAIHTEWLDEDADNDDLEPPPTIGPRKSFKMVEIVAVNQLIEDNSRDIDAVALPDEGLDENKYGNDYGRQDLSIPRR